MAERERRSIKIVGLLDVFVSVKTITTDDDGKSFDACVLLCTGTVRMHSDRLATVVNAKCGFCVHGPRCVLGRRRVVLKVFFGLVGNVMLPSFLVPDVRSPTTVLPKKWHGKIPSWQTIPARLQVCLRNRRMQYFFGSSLPILLCNVCVCMREKFNRVSHDTIYRSLLCPAWIIESISIVRTSKTRPHAY